MTFYRTTEFELSRLLSEESCIVPTKKESKTLVLLVDVLERNLADSLEEDLSALVANKKDIQI